MSQKQFYGWPVPSLLGWIATAATLWFLYQLGLFVQSTR